MGLLDLIGMGGAPTPTPQPSPSPTPAPTPQAMPQLPPMSPLGAGPQPGPQMAPPQAGGGIPLPAQEYLNRAQEVMSQYGIGADTYDPGPPPMPPPPMPPPPQVPPPLPPQAMPAPPPMHPGLLRAGIVPDYTRNESMSLGEHGARILKGLLEPLDPSKPTGQSMIAAGISLLAGADGSYAAQAARDAFEMAEQRQRQQEADRQRQEELQYRYDQARVSHANKANEVNRANMRDARTYQKELFGAQRTAASDARTAMKDAQGYSKQVDAYNQKLRELPRKKFNDLKDTASFIAAREGASGTQKERLAEPADFAEMRARLAANPDYYTQQQRFEIDKELKLREQELAAGGQVKIGQLFDIVARGGRRAEMVDPRMQMFNSSLGGIANPYDTTKELSPEQQAAAARLSGQVGAGPEANAGLEQRILRSLPAPVQKDVAALLRNPEFFAKPGGLEAGARGDTKYNQIRSKLIMANVEPDQASQLARQAVQRIEAMR